MNKQKAITALLLLAVSFTIDVSAAPPTTGAYVNDEQRFFVEGQPVTETIETANSIVCLISKMSPESFIGDGGYQAKVYDERCDSTGADSTAEQASATASSSQSSTTATAGQAASELETETTMLATLVVEAIDENPKDPNAAQPMRVRAWVDEEAVNANEIDYTVYLEADITSGASAASPNGEFLMRWSIHSKGLPSWFFADDFGSSDIYTETVTSEEDKDLSIPLGQGYLEVSGQALTFKEYSAEFEGNVALKYLDNDSITGIYGQQVGFCMDCETVDFEAGEEPTFRSFSTFYQFFVDVPNKRVCSKLGDAYENCYDPGQNGTCSAAFSERDTANADNPDYDNGQMIRLPVDFTEFSEMAKNDPYQSVDVEEACYSTVKEDATRNVFRYGVYNQQGARASTTVEGTRSAFSMFADVEVDIADPDNEGETIKLIERVFGYADYWGVFIDPRGQRLVEAGVTQFTPEVFGDQEANESGEYFTVAETEVRVEKRSKSFVALNDLDKLKLGMYVQDAYWSTEYKDLLGFDVMSNTAYPELEGYFDAKDQKFVFDKGVRFFPNYEVSDLATKIEFTPADWISKMKKVEDYGWTDENGEPIIFTDVRSLGVWSNDTRQWYDINPAALKDPTLTNPVGEAPEFYDPFDQSRGGITTEQSEFVSPASLTEELVCIQDCLTPEKVQATFGYAYCAINGSDLENCSEFIPSETGSAPAPFAEGGPFLAENTNVIRVQENGDAKRITDNFYIAQTGNTLQRDGFKLASGNAQFIDYVYVAEDTDQGIEAKTLTKHMAVVKTYKEDGRLGFYLEGELDAANLNRLISGAGGKAPIITFDLQSAPAVGDSGETEVEIVLTSPAKPDRTLIAKVPVTWKGTEAGFTLSVAAGQTIALTYQSGEIEVTATYTNAKNRLLGYSGGVASNRGRTGLTLRLLSLFNSDAWSLVGLNAPDVFEPDTSYDIAVAFGSGFTFHELEDAGDAEQALNVLQVGFYVGTGENSYYTEEYTKGQWWDGIRGSSLVRYQPNASGFDVASIPLSKGSAINTYLRGVDDPWNAFGAATYARSDGWQESLNWGLRTGQLVAASDLSKLECNNNDGVYEDHPAFTGDEETETRYCVQKLQETVGLTTYSISLDIQPSYALLNASGEPVNIAAPRTMYYKIPDEAVFGRDAGKRVSLEFAGHGELRGIPGFVFDTETGEDKGEFVNAWKSTYRYLSRFTIPDGSVITDLAGVEYFVKALDGEEWLKALDTSVTASGQYTLTREDLVKDEELTFFGSDWSPDYIGEAPTCDDPDNTQTCKLIYGGKPAVVHGELSLDADPTP